MRLTLVIARKMLLICAMSVGGVGISAAAAEDRITELANRTKDFIATLRAKDLPLEQAAAE